MGQAAAILLLVLAVGPSVHRALESVLAMYAGGLIAVLLQALNSVPDSTLLLRLAVAAIAAAAAVWVGLQVVGQLGTAPSYGNAS
jgi:hypothetical protein